MISDTIKYLYTDFLEKEMVIRFKTNTRGRNVLMWNQNSRDEWYSVGPDILGGDSFILKYQNIRGCHDL